VPKWFPAASLRMGDDLIRMLHRSTRAAPAGAVSLRFSVVSEMVSGTSGHDAKKHLDDSRSPGRERVFRSSRETQKARYRVGEADLRGLPLGVCVSYRSRIEKRLATRVPFAFAASVPRSVFP
jgi:hypothetical protein